MAAQHTTGIACVSAAAVKEHMHVACTIGGLTEASQLVFSRLASVGSFCTARTLRLLLAPCGQSNRFLDPLQQSLSLSGTHL